MLADKSPAYMAARSLVKDFREVIEACDRQALAVPPEHDAREADRLSHWGRWLAWERSNVLRQESSAVAARVLYAYKCAVMCLRLYPDIWIDLAQYLLASGSRSEAEAQLQTASQLFPTDFLVNVSLAEMIETSGQRGSDAKAVYERTIAHYEELIVPMLASHPNPADDTQLQSLCEKLTHVYIEFMQFSRRTEVSPLLFSSRLGH